MATATPLHRALTANMIVESALNTANAFSIALPPASFASGVYVTSAAGLSISDSTTAIAQ